MTASVQRTRGRPMKDDVPLCDFCFMPVKEDPSYMEPFTGVTFIPAWSRLGMHKHCYERLLGDEEAMSHALPIHRKSVDEYMETPGASLGLVRTFHRKIQTLSPPGQPVFINFKEALAGTESLQKPSSVTEKCSFAVQNYAKTKGIEYVPPTPAVKAKKVTVTEPAPEPAEHEPELEPKPEPATKPATEPEPATEPKAEPEPRLSKFIGGWKRNR